MRSAVVAAAVAATALVVVVLVGYAGVQMYGSVARLTAGMLRKTSQMDVLERIDEEVSIVPAAERETKSGGISGRVALEPGIKSIGKFRNWMTGPRADKQEKVTFNFALRRSPEMHAKLERMLLDSSTPGNPLYGQFYTMEEIMALAPTVPGSQQAVVEWLGAHAVKGENVLEAGSIIQATMTVEVAEAMLDTQLRRYTHRRLGVTKIRASTMYTVPSEVAWALYVVGDLVQLPALDARPTVKKEKSPRTSVAAQDEDTKPFPNDCERCSGFTTPGVLRLAYNYDLPAAGQMGNMSIAQFQGVSYSHKDLEDFQNKCNLPFSMLPANLDGPNHEGWCNNFFTADICLESLLDIEYIKSTAGDAKLTVVSDEDYSLYNWAVKIKTREELQSSIQSVSYGDDEVQQESPEYMDSVNEQFMEIGSMGMSILFASGDMGVYGRTGVTDDGQFHPDFPSASPYVTAVGGTDFVREGQIGEEMAWGASGGGFSNHFAMPDYQKEAVEKYLQLARQTDGYPDESHFNATSRGYPDVSALGGMVNPYCVDTAGLFGGHIMVGVGGTSASCPVVAGIFTRINSRLAENGKTPLGFLNPFIYQNGDAFNDVTQGDNSWKGDEGFRALQGWDASTGWGTPNFAKLVDRAMILKGGTPAPGPDPTYAPIDPGETLV